MSGNEYMRVYMAKRYQKRRMEAIEFLGGKCVGCGGIDRLQFDHIDRENKKYTISKIWMHSKKKFWEEIKKCQLLCLWCHQEKTFKELGFKRGKGNHGTLSSYRYCHCVICKKAHGEWHKEYYKNHKRVTINGKRVVIKTGA